MEANNESNEKKTGKGLVKTLKDLGYLTLGTIATMYLFGQYSSRMAQSMGPYVTRDHAEVTRKGLETDVTRSYYGIKITLQDKNGDDKVDLKKVSFWGINDAEDSLITDYDQKQYDDALNSEGGLK